MKIEENEIMYQLKTIRYLLRTTVTFVVANLEIFHCTHHPEIPESNLYFTFCSTLNALSKRTSRYMLMDYLVTLGNRMNPNRLLNGCEINVHFALSDI